MNSWTPPMIEISEVKISVGFSSGSVIEKNCRLLEAPSIAAASYRSLGIACIEARKISAL